MKKLSTMESHSFSLQSIESNALTLLHPSLIQIPVLFRDMVCQQCSWSVPTYYRKVKGMPLSNAEAAMIIILRDIVLKSPAGNFNEAEKILISTLPRELILDIERQSSTSLQLG